MILLLLLASLLASPSASTRPGFDYFVLALQWPGTVCRSSAAGPCCSSNARCRSVHLPVYSETKKHGTCSYPVIQDEYSYFSTALHLYSNYNVTATLASKNSVGADDGGDCLPLDCKNGENDSEYATVEQGRSSCPRRISLPSYKPHGGDTSGATRRFTANKVVAFIACAL
ncbi:ribonuclease 2-like [Miscanthus floridulus]|uniref:ribonuclease 2-like n=1 Tax=Miscanthus floridulus TaxID=154761 RepID=UPI0034586137